MSKSNFILEVKNTLINLTARYRTYKCKNGEINTLAKRIITSCTTLFQTFSLIAYINIPQQINFG